MAEDIGEIRAKITADASNFNKNINSASKTLSSFSKTSGSGFSKISTAAVAAGNVIANVLTAAFQSMSAQMDDAISRFDTINNFSNVMSNLGISTEVSEAAINKLSEKLLGLPTTLDDAVSAVQRLTASNGSLEASTDMFLALNNAIIAGTNDEEKQAAALEQLLQAYSKGKPEMQDWKTLLQAMPAQLSQIATAMGYVSTDQLYSALQNGKISMNDFMNTIMKLNDEGVAGFASFAEQAKSNCSGVATSITNMKTAITRGLTNIMNAIGQSNISSFFSGITSAISTVMNYVAAFVKVIKQAVAWVSTLFGGSGSTEDLVKETSSAADNVGAVSSGASDAADSLDDATSSAKKLNSQLAAFDEMNVLKEDTSSGSGSGSSGSSSGGGNTITDYSWSDAFDSGADKVDEIAAKIQGAFEKLNKFLQNAFPKTIKRLSSLFNNLGKIGSDTAGFLQNTWATFGDNITVSMDFAADGIVALWDSVWASLLAGIDGFVAGFAERWSIVGQTATDSMARLLVSLLGTIGVVAEQLSVPFDTLSGYLSAAGSNIGTLVAQIMTDFLTSFAEQAPSIQDNFLSFTKGLTGTLTTFADTAGFIWESFTGGLKDLWDKYGKDITDGVAEAVKNIIGTFQRIYDEIIGPIINPFLEEFKKVWDEHIQQAINKVGEFVSKLITATLDIYNKFISPIVNWLIDTLSPIIVTVGNVIGGVINWVFSTLSDVISSIFTALGGVVDFIAGVFTGNWERAWNGVKDIFSGIATAIGNIFKYPINFIIDCINGFIRGLNNIKIPDWVPGVGGKGFNLGEIPRLAAGGVVTSPTTALIGEAGKEVVLPLENNTSWMDELASKINGGGQPVYLTVKVGERDVAKAVIDNINSLNKLNNRCLINL